MNLNTALTSKFVKRIHAVMAIIRNTDGVSTKTLQEFEHILTSLIYTAPEVLGAFNRNFGALCMRHDNEFQKLNIALSIQDIMSGKHENRTITRE